MTSTKPSMFNAIVVPEPFNFGTTVAEASGAQRRQKLLVQRNRINFLEPSQM